MEYLGHGNANTTAAEAWVPVVVTGVNGERQHYDANYPEYQDFRPARTPEPWAPPMLGVVNRLSTGDVGLTGHRAPPNSSRFLNNSPSASLRQNLHVATDVPSGNAAGMWTQRGPGISLVQSPSSYSLPSPTLQGIPSIPRYKIVDITFDGVSYARVDVSRHPDAGAIRRDIISRLPPTANSFSKFDLFRVEPPGSDAPLNDWQLMLDVEHFGDDRGSLKFLVRVADGNSDSRLPTHARAATLSSPPNYTHPIRFPSADLSTPSPHSPSPHSPIAGSSERYRPDVPYAELYTQAPRSFDNLHSGRFSIPMPIPMPAPAPIQQPAESRRAPEFPSPGHSVGYASVPTFPTPTPEDRLGRPFVSQPGFINPEVPIRSNNMIGAKRSRHASDYYGGQTPEGGIVSGHHGEYQRGMNRVDARPHSVVIGGTMTTDEVLSHLYERGCRNVASELNSLSISRDPIARGGGGDVYSGELYSSERVALKCVRLAIGSEDRSKLKKTAHELYIWSKCNHLNVLELIGVTRYRDQVAMVSPWMDNGDLPTFLRRNPDADRYDLCVQITDGVAYLHEQTIVHGDIKGANVLISQDHVAKITDFGTSALKHYTLEFATTKSRPGLSIRWAAPEILEDKSDNSYQADVYSLAMTILEAITGEVPYANTTKDCAVIRHITQGTLPARPDAHIPSNDYYGDLLWSLLSQCWAYEHLSRPTAVEVQHQLRTIVF